MQDDRQLDIADILREMRDHPKAIGGHHRRVLFCMRYWAGLGWTIEKCATSPYLNLSIGTLKKYAREGKIRFSDYIPYEMRTEEERKRKRAA